MLLLLTPTTIWTPRYWLAVMWSTQAGFHQLLMCHLFKVDWNVADIACIFIMVGYSNSAEENSEILFFFSKQMLIYSKSIKNTLLEDLFSRSTYNLIYVYYVFQINFNHDGQLILFFKSTQLMVYYKHAFLKYTFFLLKHARTFYFKKIWITSKIKNYVFRMLQICFDF